MIRVEDDGIGIAPDLLPRMFDLFVQGERGLDRSEGGLGLGLTLVRRLVNLHGGTVAATSPGTGRGSEFEVRLPLDEGAGRRARETAPATAGDARYRVLVVDDNEDSAETMATLVGMWGHDVRTAARRRERPAGRRRAPPGGRPPRHRPAARLRLRGRDADASRCPACEGAVLIAMTGYGQEEDRRRTREAGFTASPHEAGAAGHAEGGSCRRWRDRGAIPLHQRRAHRDPAAAPPLAPEDGRRGEHQREQPEQPRLGPEGAPRPARRPALLDEQQRRRGPRSRWSGSRRRWTGRSSRWRGSRWTRRAGR